MEQQQGDALSVQWFKVKLPGREIGGFNRSSKGDIPPAPSPDTEHVAATDQDIEEYGALQRQARADGRHSTVLHKSGKLALPDDERDIFSLVSDKTQVDTAAAETANLTLTQTDGQGRTDTAFDGDVLVTAQTQTEVRVLKFTLANGVGSRPFTLGQSGGAIFDSTPEMKLEESLTLTFVE